MLQEETVIQSQKEKEMRKLNSLGDEEFIPTKNVAGPPVFYPQGMNPCLSLPGTNPCCR